MSKSQQLLVLEPPVELKFKGPFTDVVTAELKMSNPSKKRIGFKVKTTAPKQYCVRPNNGLIEPGATISVAVMLQPFNYDPNEKNRHKFLVQALIVPDGVTENHEMLWKDTPADQLMESKLKCVFDVDADLVQQMRSSDVTDGKGSEDYMRRELHQLREENTRLKDEGLRQRRGLTRGDVSSTDQLKPALAPGEWSLRWVIYLLLIAIVALSLGIAIGRFIN